MKDKIKRFLFKPVKTRWKLTILILSWLILGSLFASLIQNANAGGTGSCSPTATGSYRNEWTTPTNAYTQNNVYATSLTTSANNEQDYYNFNFAFTNFNSVLGIVVSIDAYASGTGCYESIKLTWDNGISWTSAKNSANFGLSDTNNYVNIGSSTDTWGHTWTENQLNNANFKVYLTTSAMISRTLYIDHIYIYIYYAGYPSEPTNFKSISESCSKDVNLSWLGAMYNFNDLYDYTRIQRDIDTYPTNIKDGTDICNYTGSSTPYYIDTNTDYNTLYYYSAWAFNNTYGLWSTYYITTEVRTPCNNDIAIEENLINCTGTYEYIYNSQSGYKIFNNYTGDFTWTPVNFTYDLVNCQGDVTKKKDNVHMRWQVWINITGNEPDFYLYDNIINATGTHNYMWDNINWIFKVWANYTGNTTGCNATNIHLLQNIINATGTHQYILNTTGYYVWANYTGLNGTGCIGIVWVNFTDSNLTFNVSVDKSTDANTSSYHIKDDNWIYLGSMLVLDNAQFFLLFLTGVWAFLVSKMKDDKIFGLFQLFIGIPLSFMIFGISYFSSITYGYLIGGAFLFTTCILFVSILWRKK